VIVSIAGLGIFKPVHEHTEDEWDVVLGANVKALFHASRHAIPVMKSQQSGLFLVRTVRVTRKSMSPAYSLLYS